MSYHFSHLNNIIINQKTKVLLPLNKKTKRFVKFLYQEGFLDSFYINTSFTILLTLKTLNNQIILNKIIPISKTNLGVYLKVKHSWEHDTSLGIFIMSTNKGFISLAEAKKKNLGGKIICFISLIYVFFF